MSTPPSAILASVPRLGFVSARPRDDEAWLRIALDILAPRVGVAFRLMKSPDAARKAIRDCEIAGVVFYGFDVASTKSERADPVYSDDDDYGPFIHMARADGGPDVDPRRATIAGEPAGRRVVEILNGVGESKEAASPKNRILYFAAQEGAIFSRAPCRRINADLVRMAWFLASRREEVDIPMRDDHDRVPSAFTYQVEQGDIERPLIDEAAAAIADFLREARVEPRPIQPWKAVDGGDEAAPMAACLTYDIDSLRKFPPIGDEGLRALGGVLRREGARHPIRLAGQLLGKLASRRDPHTAALEIVKKEAERGGRPTVFVVARRRHRLDPRYEIGDPALKELHAAIVRHGGEFALHPGYEAGRDAALLAEGITEFGASYGAPPAAARLHYLRWDWPRTPRALAEAGIRVDATLGWADAPGFRCGTAFPLPLVHPTRDETLQATSRIDENAENPASDNEIVEVPLHYMDTTVLNHLGQTPAEAVETFERLARAACGVGGVFCSLDHPHTASDAPDPDWRGVRNACRVRLDRLGARRLTITQAADLWTEAAAPYKTIVD